MDFVSESALSVRVDEHHRRLNVHEEVHKTMQASLDKVRDRLAPWVALYISALSVLLGGSLGALVTLLTVMWGNH